MGIVTKNGDAVEETVQARLARHFLARLVRAARIDSIEMAVEGGLLAEAGQAETAEKGRKTKKTKAAEAWPTIADFGLDTDDDVGMSSDAATRGRRFRLGPRLAGLSRAKVVRVLKRAGVSLDGASAMDAGGAATTGRERRSATEAEHALVTDVVRAIRAAAEPPNAADVATLYLLADAFRGCGPNARSCLAALRTPQPIVSIVCPTEGFESNLLSLLRQGLVLPGRVATSDGHDLRWRHDVRFSGSDDARWKAVIFRGRTFDDADAAHVRRQVGIAAQAGYPILGIAEADERLSDSLRLAAGLALNAGPLTVGVVGATMDAVLGESPIEMEVLGENCHLLTLSDLAVAIRPGVAADTALHVLWKLTDARHRSEEGGTSGGKSGRSGGGSSGGNGSSSSSSLSRRGSDQGTGSEIIKPVPVLRNGALDLFVPSVETLSGYGEARDWALALKDDLKLWREGHLEWDEMSVKLLLSGPPGTGKTTFARALCNSLQVPLIATSVATWLEPGYLGDVIKRMRRAFEEASSHSPAILFIDEIDGIAKRSSDGRSYEDYWNSVVNRALELLDGTAKSSGVIVVGATNNPDAIDAALRRSGRLERHIVIPRPDTDALVGILRHHLRHDIDHVIATRPSARPLPDHVGQAASDASAADGGGDSAIDGGSGDAVSTDERGADDESASATGRAVERGSDGSNGDRNGAAAEGGVGKDHDAPAPAPRTVEGDGA